MKRLLMRCTALLLLCAASVLLRCAVCSADEEVLGEIFRDIEAEQREMRETAQAMLLDERRAQEAEKAAEESARAAWEQAAHDASTTHRHTVGDAKQAASHLKDAASSSRLQDTTTSAHRSKDRMPPKTKRNPYGDEFATSVPAPSPAPSPTDSTNRRPSSPLGGRANTMQQELERMLENDLLKYAQPKTKQGQDEKPTGVRPTSQEVGRKSARPVEQVMQRLEKRATHYEILGLRQGARADEIKQAYRNLALAVHPDKNPHPDAKAAFSAIQAAYDALINPSTRISYDNALNRRPPAIRRWMRKASNNLENAYARSLLFFKRVRTGDWQIELRELKGVMDAVLVKLGAMLRKIARQPTVKDRFHLIGEIAWDNKFKLATAFAFGSLLTRRRR